VSDLILPGRPAPPAPEQVRVSYAEPVLGADGRLYEMRIEGTAEMTRGPLGRFIDLAAQIEAEGLEVPPQISDVLAQLQEKNP
jgi:hypothetical protein